MLPWWLSIFPPPFTLHPISAYSSLSLLPHSPLLHCLPFIAIFLILIKKYIYFKYISEIMIIKSLHKSYEFKFLNKFLTLL
jgi:hypothetical protein